MNIIILMLSFFMLSFANAQAMEINYNGSFQNCIDYEEIEMNLDEIRVPGDELEETIHFQNVLDDSIHLDLVLESEDMNIYDFTIYKDGKEIYSKTMNEIKEDATILLGEFEKGEECDLTFKISLPVSLNNDYTLYQDTAKWQLIIEEESEAPNTGIYSNNLYLAGAALSIGALIVLGGKRKHE